MEDRLILTCLTNNTEQWILFCCSTTCFFIYNSSRHAAQFIFHLKSLGLRESLVTEVNLVEMLWGFSKAWLKVKFLWWKRGICHLPCGSHPISSLYDKISLYDFQVKDPVVVTTCCNDHINFLAHHCKYVQCTSLQSTNADISCCHYWIF